MNNPRIPILSNNQINHSGVDVPVKYLEITEMPDSKMDYKCTSELNCSHNVKKKQKKPMENQLFCFRRDLILKFKEFILCRLPLLWFKLR